MDENVQQPTPQTPPQAAQTAATSKDANTWGMLCHLIAFAGFVIPFGNIIGPLVIWLIKKDQYEFVDDQGKESLNFQISMTIYFIISAILTVILIGVLLLIALAIFDIVVLIIATIKANGGEKYRYPLTIRLIK
jgi:uncharacterized Tic20 family protein